LIKSDSGIGLNGCHIGYSCTDTEKDTIISYIWTKYYKEIHDELIFPKISWFSPKFKDL
jgi:hypothetical protein